MHINNKLNWLGPAEITIIRRAVILALVCRCSRCTRPAASVQAAFYKKRILFHPMIYAWFMGAFSIHNTSKVGRERFSNRLHSHQLRAISMDKNRFNKFICFPQWHKIGRKLNWIGSILIQYFLLLMSRWRHLMHVLWQYPEQFTEMMLCWRLSLFFYLTFLRHLRLKRTEFLNRRQERKIYLTEIEWGNCPDEK